MRLVDWKRSLTASLWLSTAGEIFEAGALRGETFWTRCELSTPLYFPPGVCELGEEAEKELGIPRRRSDLGYLEISRIDASENDDLNVDTIAANDFRVDVCSADILGEDSVMFWRRSNFSRNGESVITLTTQLSVNRLDRLKGMTQRWKGPVSAAVLISSEIDVQNLCRWYVENKRLADRWLDLHLVFGSLDRYPINVLRNTALRGVKTEDGFEAIVDVDLWIGGDMRQVSNDLKRVSEELSARYTSDQVQKIVFCFSAFEFADPWDHRFPNSFEELRLRFMSKEIRPMHYQRRSYKGSFSHKKWLHMQSGNPQAIQYEVMFEPYFITRSLASFDIKFPEQFVGTGFNKQALHFELFAAGFSYIVLRQSYVIDLQYFNDNGTAPSIGIPENRALWVDFRKKVGAKYGLKCLEGDWTRCDQRSHWCSRVCKGTNRDKHSQYPRHSRRNRANRSLAQLMAEQESMYWAKYMEYHATRTLEGKRLSRIVDNEGHEISCFKDGKPKIDFVFTWVNGSDPLHAESRERYISDLPSDTLMGNKISAHGSLTQRFRDFDSASTLRFALRSIRQFAPWANKIWIVTADQVPSWLDIQQARESGIEFVNHSSIFPEPDSQLPTFNSCAIESQIHRIKGLATCYVYMNDDFFITRPLKAENLFQTSESGQLIPKVQFSGERVPRYGLDFWQQKLANVGRLVQRKLNLEPQQVFSVGHYGILFVKPVVAFVVEVLFKEDFYRTSLDRWRSRHSVWLPLVYNNYYTWRFNVTPETDESFYFAITTSGGSLEIKHAFERLLTNQTKYQWACFNDVADKVSEEMKEHLRDGFYRLFPDPQRYEI